MKIYFGITACAAFIFALGFALGSLGCGNGANTTRQTDAGTATPKLSSTSAKKQTGKTKTTEKGKNPDDPNQEGFTCGVGDKSNLDGKHYIITCENIDEKAKRPGVFGGQVILHPTPGVPFFMTMGKMKRVIDDTNQVGERRIGRGFRGVIAEDDDGKALLDITFEDADTITDVQDGTEIRSRAVRWVKADFCQKPLEFRMKDDKGELLWSIRMTITETKPSD